MQAVRQSELVDAIVVDEGLDGGAALAGRVSQDFVHPRKVADDTSMRRRRPARQVGARSSGDEWHPQPVAEVGQSDDLVRGLGEDHGDRPSPLHGGVVRVTLQLDI